MELTRVAFRPLAGLSTSRCPTPRSRRPRAGRACGYHRENALAAAASACVGLGPRVAWCSAVALSCSEHSSREHGGVPCVVAEQGLALRQWLMASPRVGSAQSRERRGGVGVVAWGLHGFTRACRSGRGRALPTLPRGCGLEMGSRRPEIRARPQIFQARPQIPERAHKPGPRSYRVALPTPVRTSAPSSTSFPSRRLA